MKNVKFHIQVSVETKKEIEKIFKTSAVQVHYCLNFKRKSITAKKIQKTALEKGGKLYIELPVDKLKEFAEKDFSLAKIYQESL